VLIETKGDTLLLSTNKSRKDRKKKINVHITFTQLTDINSSITGELICTNPIKQAKLRYKSTAMGKSKLQLEVDDLSLNISANGDTHLSGKANNCDFKNNSTGHIKAGDLIVENMQISTAALGSMEYYANNVTIVRNISLGNLTNKKKKNVAQ
jgi:Putative auto-transporter adhesin, head GIN domain